MCSDIKEEKCMYLQTSKLLQNKKKKRSLWFLVSPWWVFNSPPFLERYFSLFMLTKKNFPSSSMKFTLVSILGMKKGKYFWEQGVYEHLILNYDAWKQIKKAAKNVSEFNWCKHWGIKCLFKRIKEGFCHDSVTALPSYFIGECKCYFWLPGAVGTAFSAIHAGTNPEQVILRCNSEETFSQGQREVPTEYFLSLKEKRRDAVFSLTRACHEKEKLFFPSLSSTFSARSRRLVVAASCPPPQCRIHSSHQGCLSPAGPRAAVGGANVFQPPVI